MRAEGLLAVLLLAQGCGSASNTYTTDDPSPSDLIGEYELVAHTQSLPTGTPLRLTLRSDGGFTGDIVYRDTVPVTNAAEQVPSWGNTADFGTWVLASIIPNPARAITNWGVYLRRSEPEYYPHFGGTQAFMVTGYKGHYGLSYGRTNTCIWRKIR